MTNPMLERLERARKIVNDFDVTRFGSLSSGAELVACSLATMLIDAENVESVNDDDFDVIEEAFYTAEGFRTRDSRERLDAEALFIMWVAGNHNEYVTSTRRVKENKFHWDFIVHYSDLGIVFADASTLPYVEVGIRNHSNIRECIAGNVDPQLAVSLYLGGAA